jgi:hypothetical protein
MVKQRRPSGRSLAQHIDLTEDAPLSISRDVRIDPRPLGLMTGKSNRDAPALTLRTE